LARPYNGKNPSQKRAGGVSQGVGPEFKPQYLKKKRKKKKNTNTNKCWLRCEEKGTLIHCWWECKLVQLLWKTVWRLLKKLKLELPYDPAIPVLGIYLKECESRYNKDTSTPMLIAALFTIAVLWKQPRCPTTSKWI
jgi:hypothetical protein